jgi:predicted amidohydrolase YtcJ
VTPKKAFTNATVYLGGGRSIDKGLVITDGATIAKVGATGDLPANSDLQIFDLDGMLLLPGLTDSHLHLVDYALSLGRIDLADTHSIQDGLRMVRSYVEKLPSGSWLIGRGWDKQRWRLESFPDRRLLDRVSPENPVALVSRDGHLVWVNSEALRVLGLTDGVPEIDGGEIEKDRAGEMTGILKERAAEFVLKPLEAKDRQSSAETIRSASQRLIAMGLTCVHTIESRAHAELLDYAVEQGSVDLNLFRLREAADVDEVDSLSPSDRAACIKIYADGTLGSQTASMMEPYSGTSENVGISSMSKHKLRQLVRLALERGFSVAVHAIGDRANMDVLDAYRDVTPKARRRKVVRRIEHAQILRPEDISRFGQLEVVASMQPIHLVADMAVAEKYLGPRCSNAYVWKSIISSDGLVAFGSDAPIEDADPLKGIHAAVTRQDPAKPAGPQWYASQCLGVSEAIDCYTVGAAIAAGMDDITGRIGVGLRADFTVLDTNILDAAPSAILKTRVVATVIGGKIHGGL